MHGGGGATYPKYCSLGVDGTGYCRVLGLRISISMGQCCGRVLGVLGVIFKDLLG